MGPHREIEIGRLIETIRNAGVVLRKAAFIRVGRIIGPGRHVYESCCSDAAIMHPVDNLRWDGQKDLVGLASINDVKGAARHAVGPDVVKNDSQVAVGVGQPI
jgi:hypothetical protein